MSSNSEEREPLQFMAVMAHPHDFTHVIGLLGIHRALGDAVVLVSITDGASTHNEALEDECLKPLDERDPALTSPEARIDYSRQKEEELQKAAALFGITDVHVLQGKQPFVAKDSQDVLTDLEKLILQYRPDVMITQSPHLYYHESTHHKMAIQPEDDHLETAQAVMIAGRMAGEPNPERNAILHRTALTLYPGVYYPMDEWDFVIDVSDFYLRRVKAESMFKSQGQTDAFAARRVEVVVGNHGWFHGVPYGEGYVCAQRQVWKELPISPMTLARTRQTSAEKMNMIALDK